MCRLYEKIAMAKKNEISCSRIKPSLILVNPLEAATNKAAVIYRVKFEYREAREMRIVNPIYCSWAPSIGWS